MPSIKESARKYESKQTKNIADLKTVDLDLVIFEGKATDREGKDFTYNYIEVGGEEYRIPDQVLKDLKAILEKKPTLKNFSVIRQGTGINTKYTVIPLD